MKYQKYDKYKISNNPWFSELPENWDVSRIKLNSILFGRIGYRGYSTDDLVDEKEGAITLSPSNMINGKLDFSKCTYLSWDKYNESPEIKMRDHDVVMVKTGSTIGKVSFAEKIEYPTTINPQLVLYKKIKCNPKFLFYYLFSKNAQDRIPLYNSGSTIPTMKQEDIGRFYLPMPSMNEQNSIVEFLDRETTHIDTLIDKKQKLIELLKEKRIALITQTVTKGLNPDVKMKDSGIEWIGKIPNEWNVNRLKFLITKSLQYGANEAAELDDVELPRYIRITDIKENGSLRDDTFRSLPKEVAQPYLLEYGDLLFARSGATVGKTFLYSESWGDAAYAGYLIRAKLNLLKVIPEFINYYTKSKGYTSWIDSMIIQATIQNVSAEKYASLFFPIPDIKEQKHIVDFLNHETKKIDGLIDKIEKAINKHQEYRIALISAAVTGKIKVT